MSRLARVLQILLAAFLLLSGTPKVLGFGREMMLISKLGFDETFIRLWGVLQWGTAGLLLFRRTLVVGACLLIAQLLYAAYFYLAHSVGYVAVPLGVCALAATLIVAHRAAKTTPAVSFPVTADDDQP